MGQFERFCAMRAGSRKDQGALRNHAVLGVPEDAKCIRVAWMYPDVLNLHGCRGDLMAIAHFSCLMHLPCELRRVEALADPIPLDWADLVVFPAGDLAAMPDLNRALAGKKDAFEAYCAKGGMILAIADAGALLAKKTVFLDGSESEGLGLLDMELRQRKTAFGDDLWVRTADGLELLGAQVQMADVILEPEQAAFASVIYGRGNCGDGREGARSGGVIFTHCLGPVLAKNPRLTEALLMQCAEHAGCGANSLSDGQIALELAALEDVRKFVEKKRSGELRWKK